jgi:hypothetical protein
MLVEAIHASKWALFKLTHYPKSERSGNHGTTR